MIPFKCAWIRTNISFQMGGISSKISCQWKNFLGTWFPGSWGKSNLKVGLQQLVCLVIHLNTKLYICNPSQFTWDPFKSGLSVWRNVHRSILSNYWQIQIHATDLFRPASKNSLAEFAPINNSAFRANWCGLNWPGINNRTLQNANPVIMFSTWETEFEICQFQHFKDFLFFGILIWMRKISFSFFFWCNDQD